MKERLESLQIEYERGQRHLELLDRQRQELRDRLLRIDGAIQVLEELLTPESVASGNGREPENRSQGS